MNKGHLTVAFLIFLRNKIMNKFGVTITGADNNVDPKQLLSISKNFPFVEWGILFSNNNNTPRYPGLDWRINLYKLQHLLSETDFKNFSLSAHICGKFTNDKLESSVHTLTEIELNYNRVQFNRFTKFNIEDILKYSTSYPTPINIIVPYNKSTDYLFSGLSGFKNISVLFDSSGGRGVSPNSWPNVVPGFNKCGYAGGINPDNCESVINEVLTVVNENTEFWIDMESGIRTDNEFDLDKVIRILETLKPYV